jgi:hypothetical protein
MLCRPTTLFYQSGRDGPVDPDPDLGDLDLGKWLTNLPAMRKVGFTATDVCCTPNTSARHATGRLKPDRIKTTPSSSARHARRPASTAPSICARCGRRRA